MHFGLTIAAFGDFADPRTLASLAHEAEDTGWDGFFIWDHVATAGSYGAPRSGVDPLVDTWVALTAIAMSTDRIRFGPRVTPLPRRRPWKVARETVSLDHLSGGRLILAVGSGYQPIVEAEFARFGEEADARVRAAKLEEGLDVLVGLWGGKPFRFRGEHYQVEETVFRPTPIQSPRIPIWVAAAWPSKAPFRRVARWDGVCPFRATAPMSPDDVRAALAYIRQYRESSARFDVSLGSATPGDDRAQAADIVAPYIEAGLTWWIEDIGPARGRWTRCASAFARVHREDRPHVALAGSAELVNSRDRPQPQEGRHHVVIARAQGVRSRESRSLRRALHDCAQRWRPVLDGVDRSSHGSVRRHA